MTDIIFMALSILGCLAIIVFATYLLLERLRNKDGPVRSFGEWVKNVVEGVMGL